MLTLFVIVVVDLIGFGIIIPLLPFYGQFFGASPAVIGVLMATYSLTQFISAPILGRLSDRHGRRPILLLSLAGATVAYVVMGFTETLWLLFVVRAFGGLMAGNISAAFAYVADVTTVENRAKGMGMVGAAFGLGFIIGPAIGGLLAGSDPATANYQLPAFAAAGLSAIAFLLTLVRLKESLPLEIRQRLASKPKKRQWAVFAEIFKNTDLRTLVLLMFFSTFVFAGMEATFALWSERAFGWGPLQNGYLFAFIGLLSATIQGGLIGRLAKRFGERNLVIQGAIGLALGLALIPFSSSLPVLLIAVAIMAYGFSVITPTLNSLVSQSINEEDRGGILGTTRSASTLARVFGPTWAGYLFAMFGRDWPYYASALIMLVVAIFAVKAMRNLKTPP